jgi:isoquinoline 1-oxidoreductase alpha subunit
MTHLKINGQAHAIDADPNTPLLWIIREQIGLTGTKFGCGIAQCGVCTVQLAGAAIRSCVIPLSAAEGQEITTIEATDHIIQVVQAAWIEEQVPQCGYCQSGQIMSAVALLSKNPSPSEIEIENAMNGNICRCGMYARIKRAIAKASNNLKTEKI